MKLENGKVFNLEGALRGMRFPMNSNWKTDSFYNENGEYIIGNNDMDLAQRLSKAGSVHGKYLRQILVSVDVSGSLDWWKQADQYKVSTTTNSESFMHTGAKNPIVLPNFNMDDFNGDLVYDDETGACVSDIWNCVIDACEKLRVKYNETKDKKYWNELNRLIPKSWLQKRHWTGNYEILKNIYWSRKDHKLGEWHTFCDWIATLPYAHELIMLEVDDK